MLGEAFATACLRRSSEASIAADEVDLVGSHGQTVYHHSGVAGARRATLQLGDGDIIAVRTGRHVIADFRARDIAAGGEGAPLSPVADTDPVCADGSPEARPKGNFESGRDRQSHRARRLIQPVFLDSTPGPRMRRSTAWLTYSPAASSRVTMMGDSPERTSQRAAPYRTARTRSLPGTPSPQIDRI